MILALKTASDETELILRQGEQAHREAWPSGRQLSDELLPHIEQFLAHHKLKLANLTGIVVFRGPGSFTSLRIGITTANALAYSLNIPIVGSEGEDWFETGLEQLAKESKPQIITPLYGSEPHTTKQKK